MTLNFSLNVKIKRDLRGHRICRAAGPRVGPASGHLRRVDLVELHELAEHVVRGALQGDVALVAERDAKIACGHARYYDEPTGRPQCIRELSGRPNWGTLSYVWLLSWEQCSSAVATNLTAASQRRHAPQPRFPRGSQATAGRQGGEPSQQKPGALESSGIGTQCKNKAARAQRAITVVGTSNEVVQRALFAARRANPATRAPG